MIIKFLGKKTEAEKCHYTPIIEVKSVITPLL